MAEQTNDVAERLQAFIALDGVLWDADCLKIMDTIKGSTTKLAEFIAELLEYSRLEKVLGEAKIEVKTAQLQVYLSSLFLSDKSCRLTFVNKVS